MKNTPTKNLVATSIVALGITTLQSQASAILINISDPSNVTFTATTESSLIDSELGTADGITLVNFFTSNLNIGEAQLPGSLAVADTGDSFLTIESVNFEDFFGDDDGNDLTIFNVDDDTFTGQVFETGQLAFTGESTFDFSSFAASLPAVGSTGDIVTGFDADALNHGLVINTFEVVAVPEPSSTLLLGLSALGLAAHRRRK